MKLRAKLFDIEARGNFIVVLNPALINYFDLAPGDKVRIMSSRKYIAAIANISESLKDNAPCWYQS